MNEQPRRPIDPELEARLVALVLGEASDFERDELQRLIEERPELADFQREIADVHERMQEIGQGEPSAPEGDWKLPAEKREVVLSTFRGEATPAPPVRLATGIHDGSWDWRATVRRVTSIAAVFLAIGLLGSMLMLPAVYSTREATGLIRTAADSVSVAPRVMLEESFATDDEAEWYGSVPMPTKSPDDMLKFDGGAADVFSNGGIEANFDFSVQDGEVSGFESRFGREESELEGMSSAATAVPKSSLDGIRESLRDSVSISGSTLPSPYYLQDDVQYFPSGPEFKLPQEVTKSRAYSVDGNQPSESASEAPVDAPASASAVTQPQKRSSGRALGLDAISGLPSPNADASSAAQDLAESDAKGIRLALPDAAPPASNTREPLGEVRGKLRAGTEIATITPDASDDSKMMDPFGGESDDAPAGDPFGEPSTSDLAFETPQFESAFGVAPMFRARPERRVQSSERGRSSRVQGQQSQGQSGEGQVPSSGEIASGEMAGGEIAASDIALGAIQSRQGIDSLGALNGIADLDADGLVDESQTWADKSLRFRSGNAKDEAPSMLGDQPAITGGMAGRGVADVGGVEFNRSNANAAEPPTDEFGLGVNQKFFGDQIADGRIANGRIANGRAGGGSGAGSESGQANSDANGDRFEEGFDMAGGQASGMGMGMGGFGGMGGGGMGGGGMGGGGYGGLGGLADMSGDEADFESEESVRENEPSVRFDQSLDFAQNAPVPEPTNRTAANDAYLRRYGEIAIAEDKLESAAPTEEFFESFEKQRSLMEGKAQQSAEVLGKISRFTAPTPASPTAPLKKSPQSVPGQTGADHWGYKNEKLNKKLGDTPAGDWAAKVNRRWLEDLDAPKLPGEPTVESAAASKSKSIPGLFDALAEVEAELMEEEATRVVEDRVSNLYSFVSPMRGAAVDAEKEMAASGGRITAGRNFKGESKSLGYEFFDTTILPAEKAKAKKSEATAGLDELDAAEEAFSTFSLHVSDVSFKLARAALRSGSWPEADKVRIEEFVNAFDYGDPMPSQREKVACRIEQSAHPFLQQRNVMRVAMRTAAAGRSSSTPLRLTLLVDNSGSMERMDRQETVRRAFVALAQQLQPIDEVTLISFARRPRLLADKVKGDQAGKLVEIIRDLPSEGGTNIEAALQLAYEKALEQRVDQAQNRVILLTDGAVNLGNADPESLANMITTMRGHGIAFDAAGISAAGLNDEVLEALTRKGDGRYYLLDSVESVEDGFARQIAGALRPAAKNVKVQVQFNPERVGRYKLLGFEKHRLKKEDFRNDKVDAAEMAAEEAGVAVYQFEAKPDGKGDIGQVSVRFRDLSTGQMIEKTWPIPYEADAPRLDQAAPSLRIAASAALLAGKLRGKALAESIDLAELSKVVAELPEPESRSARVRELMQMIQQARQLSN